MSSFSWVDFADSDRQRAQDIIDLFREQDTRDELGTGTVRDASLDTQIRPPVDTSKPATTADALRR